jgi:uncharacterized damage-inducible protein DinB
LLQALASTPNDLSVLLKGMNATAAAQRPTLETWSIADVVCHLADVEKQYRARLQRVLQEERPQLPTIQPNEQAHDTTTPLPALLARFNEAREETLALLMEIKPGQWQRRGIHESKGDVTLRFLVQYLLDHDIQHLNQIVEVQQQRRLVPDRQPQPTIDRV